MATLVLSTVGTALGGPVGGAIGALIGQSIDQQLLAPASRGPRLGDLKVQSSSYGTQIPRIYGSMRVAGTVIWATDLVEGSQSSGAKGQPDTTYSYSVSLAVALSSRAVGGIGRIWADGKLLRGAAGDFKVSTKCRFYPGDQDQEVDPLIASAEGLANTPAYRGLALAVFEDLDLADFGNRIPFLTFEVIADGGSSTVGDILCDASGGLIDSGDAQDLVGYAAYGQSVRAAIQPLVDCYGIELIDDGSRIVAPNSAVVQISSDQFGCSSDNQKAAWIERTQSPASSLPAALRLGYYDPVLDYQAGEARATSAEKRGTEDQRDLAAAVSAADAKLLAQRMIAREWARRDKLTLRLPPRYLGLSPGARVDLELSPGSWCVEQSTVDGFVIVAELRPSWSATASIAADGGRIVPSEDVATGDVMLALFDIPDVLEQGLTGPTVMLAASAATPGWKSCGVEIAAGQSTVQVQTPRRKTVLGTALTALAAGDPYLINSDGSVDVELIDEDQWLVSCDDDALVGGRNLAVIGSELVQFGDAEPLGPGRFRLTRLLRGRAGTEWAMDSHMIGDAFALIEPEVLRTVPLPSWAAGATISASLRNVSGTASNSSPIVLSGESVRPLSPVALDARIDSTGALMLAWTRRSRKGFAWIDGVDAPLGESFEQYRVNITGPSGSIEVITSAPTAQVPAAELAGVGSGQVTIEVRQIGDAAASRPAQSTLTI